MKGYNTMSKAKILGIGLASLLSIASTGCSKNSDKITTEKTSVTERAQNPRQKNGREDISVTFIPAKQDYVKSINCLLSLYKNVIPMVKEDAGTKGITKALEDAYTRCRLNGLLKKDSRAYNFTEIIAMNYSGHDFDVWSKSFERAGHEAEKILSEGDSISRKFVPISTSGQDFLRRSIDEPKNLADKWKTATEFEQSHISRLSIRDWAFREKNDPRNF